MYENNTNKFKNTYTNEKNIAKANTIQIPIKQMIHMYNEYGGSMVVLNK